MACNMASNKIPNRGDQSPSSVGSSFFALQQGLQQGLKHGLQHRSESPWMTMAWLGLIAIELAAQFGPDLDHPLTFTWAIQTGTRLIILRRVESSTVENDAVRLLVYFLFPNFSSECSMINVACLSLTERSGSPHSS